MFLDIQKLNYCTFNFTITDYQDLSTKLTFLSIKLFN